MMEEMALNRNHVPPPWAWLLPPSGPVALGCLRFVSPAPLLAVEGKALSQGPV